MTDIHTTTDGAPPAAPAPGRLGQQTAVEQSRAVAEVQAAVVVAQQCPRSLQAALVQMQESCAQAGLAERAFYRYSRAENTISGASVYLARELARCWGNVQYGVAELARDDDLGQSEMQAWAWDVQTNSRASTVFIVPHKRDRKTGPVPLKDMRDIYENNANAGARRLRECIFAILPPWFTEQAKDLCHQTLAHGGGKPRAQRIADAIGWFEREHGVTVDQLEQRLDRPRDQWTDHDLAQLTVIRQSLKRGEVTRDEEFPPQRVTAAEITGQPASPAPTPGPPETDTTAEPEWPEPAQPGSGGPQ